MSNPSDVKSENMSNSSDSTDIDLQKLTGTVDSIEHTTIQTQIAPSSSTSSTGTSLTPRVKLSQQISKIFTLDRQNLDTEEPFSFMLIRDNRKEQVSKPYDVNSDEINVYIPDEINVYIPSNSDKKANYKKLNPSEYSLSYIFYFDEKGIKVVLKITINGNFFFTTMTPGKVLQNKWSMINLLDKNKFQSFFDTVQKQKQTVVQQNYNPLHDPIIDNSDSMRNDG